ncbi:MULTISPECIES: hypothetical protein [unclassified Bradyrhizobium]
MFDWVKKQLAGRQPAADDPYEQFVRAFVVECQRQGIQPKSYDPNARGFVFFRDDSSERIFRLHNGFHEWLGRNQESRAILVTTLVRSVIEGNRNYALDPGKLPEQLMPGVRSHAQISNLLIQNWTMGAPADDSSATAFRPLVGDLVVCAMQDKPNTMSQMSNANLAVGGLSIDQAMERAMANFRAKLGRPVFESLGDGLFGSNNLAEHQSALLLLTPGTDYQLPAIDGAPVALVPARGLFYLTGRANRTALIRALDIAKNAAQMAWFLSPTLLQWDGGRWGEATLTDDLAPRQREVMYHRLAADYDTQKQLLDQYHESKGQDIFVAKMMLYSKKDSSEPFSLTTLASGTTGTLLPYADRLWFGKQVVDPQTGLAQPQPEDVADVTWSDAMAIAGHLFEPVAYLYPPRLRALGFPAGDVWARLKAVAR